MRIYWRLPALGGLALAVALIGGTVASASAVADGVEVPDEQLAQGLRAELGVADGTPITREQLGGLEQLDLSGRGIVRLTGLEYATALTELNLDGNEISDVEPLSGLAELRVLELQGNHLGDLSPLEGLVKLERLVIADNNVADLRPVVGMSNLSDLFAGGNQLADLTPLANLRNLKILSVSDNKIADLNPLREVASLTDVYASRNMISDLGPLSQLIGLEQLELEGNRIDDVAPLSELPKLNNLLLGGNGVSDLKPLINVGSLRSLQIDNNGLSSLDDVARLKQLYHVGLAGNRLSDISSLSSLTSLRSLNVANNELTDLGVVSSLTSLERIVAQGNRVVKLPDLSELNALKDLYISANAIADISEIASVKKLRVLDAKQNGIVDISPLNGLPELLFVDLQGNRISDLSMMDAGAASVNVARQRIDLGVQVSPTQEKSVSLALPTLMAAEGVPVEYKASEQDGLLVEIADGQLRVSCAESGCPASSGEVSLASWQAPGADFSGEVTVKFEENNGPTVVERVHGRNRVSTSLAALQAGNFDSGTVLLASGSSFADAIAAAPLAAAEDAPIVLTGGKKLESEVLQTLQQEGFRRVVIVGGPSSVSPEIAEELRTNGFLVTGIAGKNRAETAVALSDIAALFSRPERIFLVDGQQFPDGLAAGAVAERGKAVIVLSAGDKLPEATRQFLAEHADLPVVAIGGKAGAALTASSHDPSLRSVIAGPNRYATAVAVADAFAPNAADVVVASGADFPDVLAGGALAAQRQGIILLTPPPNLPPVTQQWLSSHRPQRLVILGGPSSVYPGVEEALRRLLR